ncbi:MAG: response regulator, partial [Armatimonadota bacterium]
IDDESGPRASLRMILKNDYNIVLASGAREGLQMLEEENPDIVFLDIKMPEMDGIEVLQRIKDFDKDIEVAMITAYAAVDTAQQALRHGAIDYLTKPFSVDEVNRVIDRALTRRKHRREQQALLEQLQPTTQEISSNLDQIGHETDINDQAAIFENLTSAHSSIEDQLNRIGRLTAIGEIAAEVAHDVGNFLSAILLRIEVLMLTLKQGEELDTDSIRDALQDIVQAARDSAQAVKRISGMSSSADDPYQPSDTVDINSIVKKATDLSVGKAKKDTDVDIRFDLGDCPEITGSPPALRTALTNLIINARQSIENHGEIILRTRSDDETVTIQVIDNGPGIPDDLLHRITEPFFTTKGDHGSGLGLSVAQRIVTRHRGQLHFDTEIGRGTTVTISLPVDFEAAAMSTADESCEVLVLDDDLTLLETVEAFLTNSGLRVETFGNGPAGLTRFEELVETPSGAPAVVVADLRMPELLGTDLAKHIKEIAPETRVILLSGYISSEDELASCPYLDVVMQKPIKLSDLLEEIRPGMQASTA